MKTGLLHRLFTGLLGKFLLSYLAIMIVSAIITEQIMNLYSYNLLRRDFNPESVATETNHKAGQAARFFNFSAPNVEALNLWLEMQKSETQNNRREIAPDIFTLYDSEELKDFYAVIDRSGTVLAATGKTNLNKDIYQTGESLLAVEINLLKTAVSGEAIAGNLIGRDGDLRISAVSPIRDQAGTLRGALLVRKSLPFEWNEASFYLFLNWVEEFYFLLVIFVYTGLVFSFFVARHLIKRLNRIGAAANAWSVGDFSARAVDESSDEIGLLTRKLNSMAIQLSDFFDLKQNLVAVEERNRLARELHDSVKQQVFALSMQIGAATRVLSSQVLSTESSNGRTDDDLSSRLHEAEKLANQVQHELQVLINELRPSSEAGEPLNLRLKTLAADWSRLNSIATETRLEKIPPLSPKSEHALFRIAQEALANAARHAQATKVMVELELISPSKLQLSISDNGSGFESLQQRKGLGLKTMRERAEGLSKGWFEVQSLAKSGTRITAGCSVEKS